MITFAKLTLEVIAILIMVCVLAEQLPTRNIKRMVLALVLVIVGGMAPQFFFGDASSTSIISEVWVFVVTAIVGFVLVEIPIKNYSIYYVITTLITSIVQPFIKILLITMNIIEENNVTNLKTEILLRIGTIIVIVIFSFLVLVIFKKSINFIEIPKRHLMVIGFMFMSTIVLFCAIAVYYNNSYKKLDTVIMVSVVLVCLTVFGVALEVIILEISKGNLQKENGMLLNYNEQQQQYYELLLKKEEDTRRYRHDMLNHMICINDLLDQGNIDEVKEYLSNITSDLSSVRKDLYHSGNRIADVIMTNIFSDKPEGTKITIIGQLESEMNISDYDLCIVLSNILKNAVEAVNRQSEQSEKYIKVKFSVGKRFFRIEEWNSIDSEQVKKAQTLETSKDDKHRHGLGTKNIKLMAEKYNGDFSTEVKDNEFYICVDLDLKKSKNAK